MKPLFLRFSLLLMLLLAAPVQAQDISKQQAMKIAQKNSPGRVLAIKRSGKNYRVKILSSGGEVRFVLVNTRNGKVSRK